MLLERIKGAIGIIREGQPFKLGDLLITRQDKNTLSVTGWTQHLYLNQLTKSNAAEELVHIKQDFQKLVSSSSDWKDFLNDKTIQYNLDYDEFGKGIGICNEINGEIKWLIDLHP
jgi:hypothetical protein